MARKQEKQAPEQASERKKQMMLGLLLVALIGVFYWQDPFRMFGSDDDTPSTTPNVAARTSPTPKSSPTPKGQKEGDRIISNVLPVSLIDVKQTPLDGIGRNIFVYPTPTPVPPPTPAPTPIPPPPPPITLVGINPAGIIGRTGEHQLTVTGLKIPQDGRIYIDGREIATTFVDESHLTGTIPSAMTNNAANLGVQVRSISDAKMFSNQVTLNVADPPPPPYRFVGLIVSRNGTIAVLKAQGDDDVLNVKVGTVIGTGNRWKIMSISAAKIVILDTAINVSHDLGFTGETG